MAKVEWKGDYPSIVDSNGDIIYEPENLEGLSERCLQRLAELAEDEETGAGLDWEQSAEILIAEGFKNIYPD